MPTNIDPILLGHNPFFGIDHLSQARGNEKAAQFSDVERIVAAMRMCHELGVRGMMMSTHAQAAPLCAAIVRDKRLAAEWRFYPLVPYMQKYVRGANEKGLVNVVLDTLGGTSVTQKFKLLVTGSRGIVSRDVQHGLKLLLDVELLPFKKLQLGAVFLHDALTDLALGLGVESVLNVFRDHIRQDYRVPAGLITKNVPFLRRRLHALGWDNPLVMAAFNAAGFWVNPSLPDCETAVREPGMTFVAMSTLAAGHLTPEAAYSYLGRFLEVAAVVVGMSNPRHADETVRAIRQHMPFLFSPSGALDAGGRR
jgi:hypothetical protein